jgi:hypothetical protein
MSISFAALLVHSDEVPDGARRVLRDALAAPAEARQPLLEAAAQILYREVGLDCADARELVGLPAGYC